MKKKLLIFALAAVMLLMAGCSQETVEAPELLVPVGASLDRTPAVMGDIEDVSVYAASVAPRYTALYFTTDTRIAATPFSLGSEVKAGDVIVAMDVSSLQQQIGALDGEAAALTAEAELARQLYDIDMELFSLNMEKAADEDAKYDIETEMLLYQLEYENAGTTRSERLTAIADEKAALEERLAGSALIAPSDGRVVYLGYSAGQTAGAYDTVCVVTDDTSPVIQSDFVSAGAIADAVEIYALVGGRRCQLTAEEVDENDYAVAMLRSGRYHSIFSADTTEGLTIGDSAAVCVVNLRKENVLKVPVNSVYEEDDQSYVYIVDGETRVRRDVIIGVRSKSEVEIVSGLQEGEAVYVGD